MEDQNKQNFLKLVSEEDTNSLEWLQERIKNRSFKRLSKSIASLILARLRDSEMTKEDLAEKMEVSVEEVDQWVTGEYNFDLETIAKLSDLFAVNIEFKIK